MSRQVYSFHSKQTLPVVTPRYALIINQKSMNKTIGYFNMVACMRLPHNLVFRIFKGIDKMVFRFARRRRRQQIGCTS